MRALAPSIGLLLLLAVFEVAGTGGSALPRHGAPIAASADLLPRGWALDLARRQRVVYRRVDRVEAKLTTLAEWYAVSGTAPLPARPAAAPGSGRTTVDAAGPTPIVPPDAAERLVWVVVASGEVAMSRGGPERWGGFVGEARTGRVIQGFASPRGDWPPYWERLRDRAAPGDGRLLPGGGRPLPREAVEQRLAGRPVDGAARLSLLSAADAADAARLRSLPAWLHPERRVWLVAWPGEGSAPGPGFFLLLDAATGVDLLVGEVPRSARAPLPGRPGASIARAGGKR